MSSGTYNVETGKVMTRTKLHMDPCCYHSSRNIGLALGDRKGNVDVYIDAQRVPLFFSYGESNKGDFQLCLALL